MKSLLQNSWLQLATLCLFLLFVQVWSQGDQIVLQVAGGIFDGTKEQVDRERRFYYSFRGIPYAEPPVGDRRWEAPVLKEVNGRTKTLSFKDKCPQWTNAGNLTVGNEDCLYLNVYSPSIPSQTARPGVVSSSRALLPVLVYIHGGAFSFGSGDTVGPRRFMRQDVVLVTFNYRLGALGFLSTGTEELAGNFGLLDQITALQWVKKYIRGFGGNPESVTVFGDSAGAVSAHILMLSPQVTRQKLFHRAIFQSGSALCDWAVEPDPLKYAEAIGEALECSGGPQELKDCLREKTPDELVRAQQAQLKQWVYPINAVPVVDNSSRPDNPVLPDHPRTLMEAGAYAQIAVMSGINHDEGLMGYSAVHLEVGPENFKVPEYFENVLVPDLLQNLFHDKGENEVVSKAVLNQYFHGINMSTVMGLKLAVGELVELIGDMTINSCHFETLDKFANNKQTLTFSYLFTHKTARSPSIISRNIQAIRSQNSLHHPLFDFGVSHSDELFYLFDPLNIFPGNVNTPLTPVDERVSEILTRVWVTFAQDGNPARALQSFDLQAWRPVGPGNINYYNLTSVSAPMGTDYRKGDALFWLRTVPYVRELGETIDGLSCYPILFYIFLGLFLLFLIITIILAIVLHKKRTSQKVTL